MDGREDVEDDDNVVRLPRDWLGPPGELVPVTPGGWARERERLAREADEAAGPPAAADFWGAGASAVHGAIAAPDPTPTTFDEAAAPDDVMPPRSRPRRRSRRPLRRLPRLSRPVLPAVSIAVPRVGIPLIAALVVVIAVATIAAIGLGEGPSRAARTHATADVTVTRSAPHGTTSPPAATPVRSRATRHRTASRTPRATRHSPRSRAPDRHHARLPSHAGSHAVVHRVVVTTTVATPTPAPSTVTATDADPVATVASDSGGASSGSRSPGSSHSSSVGSAGPTSAGSAVGCSPKCS